LPALYGGVSIGAKYPHIADERRLVVAKQAIDPYTNKPDQLQSLLFRSRPTTAS